ncbi:DedA family protein [Pseudonocardia adelaidensis]|uniref:VTT domain-containing protein n=1 Tax=Pseudonocardia adelaidensis TaxID=648754 RepID=A0ABP9NT32_9PSEU
MPDLLAFPGPVACLVVFGLLVVESGLFVGVFLPGDSMLFGAGLLVGSGRIDVPVAVLAGSAWLGAVLGDVIGYGLGRRLGRPWAMRRRRGWNRRAVATAERVYDRHGWFAIVVCRWFPGIRALVPALAGVGRMHPIAFALANGTGALLWAVGMVLIGHATASVPQTPAALAAASTPAPLMKLPALSTASRLRATRPASVLGALIRVALTRLVSTRPALARLAPARPALARTGPTRPPPSRPVPARPVPAGAPTKRRSRPRPGG